MNVIDDVKRVRMKFVHWGYESIGTFDSLDHAVLLNVNHPAVAKAKRNHDKATLLLISTAVMAFEDDDPLACFSELLATHAENPKV